ACSRRPSGKKEFEIYTLRDRLAIGLMMAAGLRREEAASIQFTDIIKQDKRYVLNTQCNRERRQKPRRSYQRPSGRCYH
ncbi:MAG: hypothetical protein WBB64_09230, partial [Anaerolineales bacterium]